MDSGADRVASNRKRPGGEALRSVFNDPFPLIDPLVVFVAGVACKFVYIDLVLSDPRDSVPFTVAALLCGLFVHLFSRQNGRESRRALLFATDRRWSAYLPRLTAAFGIVIGAGYALKISSEYSRGWVATWFISSVALLYLARVLSPIAQRALRRRNIKGQPVLLLYKGAPPEGLIRGFAAEQLSVDLHLKEISDSSIPELVSRMEFDDVVLCCDNVELAQVTQLARYYHGICMNVHLYYGVGLAEMPLCSIAEIGSSRMITIGPQPLNGRALLVKRLLDIVVSSTLLIVLAPLLALIAIAIKLDSTGPVLFRQRRNGFNWHPIWVLKFRTMTTLEDGPVVVQAVDGDPRVTRVGRFLRRTSLDELPQLYNVLKGEMSLVGPRPHALAHDEYYAKHISGYCDRLRVKPGITGWAQINGSRGPTPDPRMMEERVRLDVEYIERWSLWFDLEVLFLTLLVGFTQKNAV